MYVLFSKRIVTVRIRQSQPACTQPSAAKIESARKVKENLQVNTSNRNDYVWRCLLEGGGSLPVITFQLCLDCAREITVRCKRVLLRTMKEENHTSPWAYHEPSTLGGGVGLVGLGKTRVGSTSHKPFFDFIHHRIVPRLCTTSSVMHEYTAWTCCSSSFVPFPPPPPPPHHYRLQWPW